MINLKKNKVTINYLYNVTYQILNFIMPIITAPYLSRTLGADNLGIYGYTYSIAYWFILFGNMGIGLYGSKEIAKVSDNKEKLSKKFSEIFMLQFSCSMISMIIFYFVFGLFKFEYQMVFLIQGILIISSALDINWVYVGLEDFKKTTLRGIVSKVLLIIGLFLLIKSDSDLYTYTFLLAFINIFNSVFIWKGLFKILDFKIPKFKDLLPHLKENFLLFIPQISASIYSVFDQTMIGMLYSDVSEVAFYNQAHRIINMLLYLVTTIGTVMLPNIIKQRDDKEKVNYVTNATFKIALLLAIPIAIGFSALAPFLISWFLAPNFYKVASIIAYLSPIIIFISLSNVFGVQYLIVFDETKKFTISVTIGCFVNLILNALLISKFGAYGAAIASCITEFSVLLIQFFFVKKRFNFKGVVTCFLKYLFAASIMGIAVYYIGILLGNRLLTNIVQVIIGVLIYFGIVFLFHDDTAKFLFNKGLEILKIKKSKNEQEL